MGPHQELLPVTENGVSTDDTEGDGARRGSEGTIRHCGKHMRGVKVEAPRRMRTPALPVSLCAPRRA